MVAVDALLLRFFADVTGCLFLVVAVLVADRVRVEDELLVEVAVEVAEEQLLLLLRLLVAVDDRFLRTVVVVLVEAGLGIEISVIIKLGPSRVIFFPLPSKFTPSCHRISLPSLVFLRRWNSIPLLCSCTRLTLAPPINSSSNSLYSLRAPLTPVPL